MKRYDEKILHKLLDRYENSLLYTGENQVNISIAVPINRKTMPEYFVEGSLAYDDIHEQLSALERSGLIRLQWKGKKQGHILEKCILCVEHADEVYHVLHRIPKQQKEENLLGIAERYQGKSEILDLFLEWMKSRLDQHESVQKYVELENPQRLEHLCQLIWHITQNQQDIFLRRFSILWFHDSKIVEKNIRIVTDIIRDFQPEGWYDSLEMEEILEEFNIYRNPSWIMLKGYGCFTLKNANGKTMIDLTTLDAGIGISNMDAQNIQWNDAVKPDRILTIENLTSFHQWNTNSTDEKTLIIYLGGYHNRVKREFLKNLYQIFPDIIYEHFGDIDCGGFRIWKDLCEKTGIPFQTCAMDLQIYEAHLAYGRELTVNDRKQLKLMQSDPFFAQQYLLFARMLETNLKLEQECIRSSQSFNTDI